jgi:predicted lipoprotein with Yx(FWY)xxD motif
MRKLLLVGPGLAAAAVVLAACGSTTSPATDPPASVPAVTTTGNATGNATATGASSVAIRTVKTSKGTVLTDAAGHTLYWFAKDTTSKSNCNGSCATYWPPVIGKAVAAAGTSLPHGFGTIKRADGQIQATYNGHPLYTYTGDTAAGQVSGNGLNVSGGLWWAATPSGADLRAKKPAPSSSSSSSSSGGGW